MRIEGRVTSWKDDKGFGFIAPDGGGDEVFAHATAFELAGCRPSAGMRVSFSIGQDRRGRRCARAVTQIGASAAPQRARDAAEGSPAVTGPATLYLIPAFALVMLAAMGFWQASPGWFLLYVALSAATFGLYAVDKAQAAREAWRVPEPRLHLLALVGGWPGALMAQHVLRHKSVKPSFGRAFRVTVWLNVVLFLLLTSPIGRPLVARLAG